MIGYEDHPHRGASIWVEMDEEMEEEKELEQLPAGGDASSSFRRFAASRHSHVQHSCNNSTASSAATAACSEGPFVSSQLLLSVCEMREAAAEKRSFTSLTLVDHVSIFPSSVDTSMC
jgi:hypothetical protein